MRMKIAKMLRTLVVVTAALGFLLPNSLLAAAQPAKASHKTPVARNQTLTRDVALQKGGVLQGRFVDAGDGSASDGSTSDGSTSDVPIAGAPISLLYNNRVVARTQTDKQGRFTFSRLRGGVYQVAAPDTQQLYRLWAAGTAPKAAEQVARVVAGQSVVRGQHANGQNTKGQVGKWLKSPLCLAAVAATAIAVPVALNQSGCDSSD